MKRDIDEVNERARKILLTLADLNKDDVGIGIAAICVAAGNLYRVTGVEAFYRTPIRFADACRIMIYETITERDEGEA